MRSDHNPNFITQFIWFCSGANTKVLKQVESEHGKYANQGFAIFIIGVVGMFTGGYAISTVFSSRLVIYAGGALWGLILSSIDRSMVSGFNKRSNPSVKERIGGAVSLMVKLGISTLISFTVAKPLELKIFESSIEAQAAKNIEVEIDKYSQPIINQYQLEIDKLEGEKQQHNQELSDFQLQLEQTEDAYQKELLEGGFGRDRGYGSVAKQLEKSVEQAQQKYDHKEQTLRSLIGEKEQQVTNLRADRQEKLSEIEREVKEEQTATDFVARLHVLHQIQAEEDKIFLDLGVYEATGWIISLIFILIDAYPVINKIFSPIDNYEKLLEKHQQKEDEFSELVLTEESELQNEGFLGEIDLTRDIERGRFTNRKELIPKQLANESKQQQKKIDIHNTFTSQGIENLQTFLESYGKKCQEIGLENLEDADRLSQLRKIRNEYTKTYIDFAPNFFSNLEEIIKKNLFSQNKNYSDHPRDRFTPSQHSYDQSSKTYATEELKNSELVKSNIPSYRNQKSQLAENSKRSGWINPILKISGIVLTPLALWLGAETIAVSKIKIDPIPYPQEASSHLVYTSDASELRNPKSWKTSARELDLEEFSPTLQQALLASEDRRFYEHNGFDPYGTLRALVRTLSGNKQGGSTITQQVAKKLFIEQKYENLPELRKKLQQIVLAIRLERNYEKDEILKTYLNRIYLGHQKGRALIGFEEAAQFYFGKSARDLNIAESATLVGMLPSPSISNPIQNLELAKKMRDSRIQQLLNLGNITQEEAKQALESEIEIEIQSHNYPDTLAPYAYDRVMKELANILGEDLANSGQFIVKTTLNNDYQLAAEQTLETELQTQASLKGYQEGALVTIDSQTGAILAFVGGIGTNYPVNYASEVKLSLASTFKLIPYTVAITKGFSPNDKLSCASWQGEDKYTIPACRHGDGELTLTESLARSENPPVLRLVEQVGLESIEKLSKDLELDLDLEKIKDTKGYHQQLALGTYGSTVLNITNAYAAIANQGIFNRPHIIETIIDRNNCKNPEQLNSCKVIYSARDRFPEKSVVDSQVVGEINQMLRKVVTEGTATETLMSNVPELISDYDTLGKTGTSKDNRDLWFIGSLPENNLTTGVWLGQSCVEEANKQKYCNSTKGKSSLSVTLWARYMKKVLR